MTDYSKMEDKDINTLIDAVTGNRKVGKDYCNNPADAWPIIDENNISIINDNPSLRCAVNDVASYYNGLNLCIWSAHENGLRAAMMVFLMMKASE